MTEERNERRNSMTLLSNRKKGVFFIVDAMIAASIIIVGLLLVSAFYISDSKPMTVSHISSDMIRVLSELKAYEVNDSGVNYLVETGQLPARSLNISVAELLGELWATNNTEIAINLTERIIGPMIPERFGYSVNIGRDEVAIRPKPIESFAVSSQKMISGIEKDKAILGYSTKMYLTSIKDRKTASYTYFGGFEGEGNLTKWLNLPHDFNLISAYLEVETGTDFKLYVNDYLCGEFPLGSGGGSYMVPDRWDINMTFCNSSVFHQGRNRVQIRFEPIDENFTASGPRYIAGGFFRVDYMSSNRTDLDVKYIDGYAESKYHFPGIHGFINTYSSFYVPGELHNMDVNITVDSNYSLFLIVANTTIYSDSPGGAANIYINDSQIRSLLGNNSISYADISQHNVPLRIAVSNATRGVSPFDMALVTDVSGSMNWRMDNNNNGIFRYCDDSLMNDPSTSRWSGARCASMGMIDNTLANEGPMIGLVAYEGITTDVFHLSDDADLLKDRVDNYVISGGTCICCGIRDAVDMLIQDGVKFIINRKTGGWRYDATNRASDPSGWTSFGFNDNSWSTGTSVFRNAYNSLGNPSTIVPQYGGNYYFRKKFNVTDASMINASNLFVLSDSGADVYLNGVRIDNNIAASNSATYWNRDGINVNPALFNEGENVIAVKLRNRQTCFWVFCWPTEVAFDLELAISYNDSSEINPRQKAIIVMSDGEANYRCNGAYSTTWAKQDAIDEACNAYQDYGIRIFTVGYSNDADRATLEAIANCADGEYFNSTSVDDLAEAYSKISNYLIEFTNTQTMNHSALDYTYLSPHSYISFNYTPAKPEPAFSKIPMIAEGSYFGNNISRGELYIPAGTELTSLIATSYSADRWTAIGSVSNTGGTDIFFNLSEYSRPFHELGDIFHMHIAPDKIISGQTNYVDIITGLTPDNVSTGSPYNKLVYEVLIDSVLDYTGVFDNNDGCNWTVEFSDGSSETISVPISYNGTKQCYYTNATYDPTDAMDVSAYRLFERLDLDGNGLLEVRLDQNNLLIDSLWIEDIPSMWGPEILEVMVWQ